WSPLVAKVEPAQGRPELAVVQVLPMARRAVLRVRGLAAGGLDLGKRQRDNQRSLRAQGKPEDATLQREAEDAGATDHRRLFRCREQAHGDLLPSLLFR